MRIFTKVLMTFLSVLVFGTAAQAQAVRKNVLGGQSV